MTFPTIVSTTTSIRTSTSTTSHVVTVPNTNVGNLVVLYFSPACTSLPNDCTAPESWTKIGQAPDSAFAIFAKEIQSGDPSTVTITTEKAGFSARIVDEISGWYAPITAGVAAAFTDAGAGYDAPSLTVPGGWGAADVLWFASAGARGGTAVWADDPNPTGFTGLVQRSSASAQAGTQYAVVARSYKQDAVTTLDPDAFVMTTEAGATRTSATVAIRPLSFEPVVTDITKLQDGKSAVITCSNAGSSQGDNGRVLFSPSADSADVNAVVQTVTEWASGEISIAGVDLTGFDPGDPVYVFLRDDGLVESEAFVSAVADPALKVLELIRDTDTASPVSENVEMVVLAGSPGARTIAHQNDTDAEIVSGVLIEKAESFDIHDMSTPYQVVLVGDNGRAAVLPATVVDLND